MSIPLFMPRPVRVRCPNCGMPVTVELHTIVDARRQPELKMQLLEGRLNAVVCHACQHRGVMSAPLLYHDADKEFLGIFVPQQVDMGETERQKAIGEMTTTLMNSLPPQQRKGYLFQAKQYLTLLSLLDAIVIADGVTPEQLEEQRAQMRLIQRLLDGRGNEDMLQAIVKEHDEELDYEFFALLSSMAERAKEDGEEKQARQMLALRNQLLDMTSWGKEAKKEREVLERLGDVATPEQLVEKLIAVEDDEELEMLVRLVRPLLDYGFFQTLTARLDAAAKEGQKREARPAPSGARRLRALRSRLLELTDKVDKEVQREAERATKLLRKLLESEDPRAAVREHSDGINDMLMAVLSMNLQEAERTGATAAIGRLRTIWRAIMEMLEESMPPEVRFINRLLEEEFPEGTQAMLEENREQVNDALLEAMEAIAKDLERQGQATAAKRLRDVRGQAVLMV